MVDGTTTPTYDDAFKTYNNIAEMCGIPKKEYGEIITSNEMFVALKLLLGYDESDICRHPYGDLYGYAPLAQDKGSD